MKVNGRHTSVRLEPALWECLEEICEIDGYNFGEIIGLIEQRQIKKYGKCPNLASAIRIFITYYYRSAVADCSRLSVEQGSGDLWAVWLLDDPQAEGDNAVEREEASSAGARYAIPLDA